MIVRVPCKVVLANSIVVADLEDDKLLRFHALRVAQRQWKCGDRLFHDVPPQIDDRETAGGQGKLNRGRVEEQFPVGQ